MKKHDLILTVCWLAVAAGIGIYAILQALLA